MDVSYLVANARDKDGELIVKIADLYENLIKVNGGKFASQSLKNKNRVICPFHEDIRPSLGVIQSRATGMDLFNCFGCGKHGNAVHFYIYYNRIYKKKDLSTEDATKELAEVYGISLGDNLNKQVSNTIEEVKDAIINNRKGVYTLRDFQSDAKKLTRVLDSGNISQFCELYESLQLHWLKVREN